MAKKPKKPRTAPSGGWNPGARTPVAVTVPECGKQARTAAMATPSGQDSTITWRFSEHDDDGEWSLAQITPEHLAGLIGKLRSFETMTVGELFRPGSEHGKRYAVESTPGHVQVRLTAIGRADETEIVRLRCTGRQRLYGFLRGGIFHILWWDPRHEVWPSVKKHT